MTLGEKMRQLRTAAGLTQRELAERAGVPVGTLRNIEQDQRVPLWTVVARLAAGMKVSLDEFSRCVPADDTPAPKRKGRK